MLIRPICKWNYTGNRPFLSSREILLILHREIPLRFSLSVPLFERFDFDESPPFLFLSFRGLKRILGLIENCSCILETFLVRSSENRFEFPIFGKFFLIYLYYLFLFMKYYIYIISFYLWLSMKSLISLICIFFNIYSFLNECVYNDDKNEI